MSQLTFDLPVREARGREDFFVAPSNATAVAALEAWQEWPLGKMVLTGPKGSGKTHLAHVWVQMTGGVLTAADAVTTEAVPALAKAGHVVAEDADRGELDERALFHLHNALAEASGALLLTARAAPRDWRLALPDLLSRVSAASVARLDAPDDTLLQAVILKQFADRQVTVTPDLIDWLLARIERSFDAASRAVEALDSAALAKGRPVTRALAREVLDSLSPPRG
ncbi:MAG: chromosomal replication initiator DnaA [Pseudomonadota bacterium]